MAAVMAAMAMVMPPKQATASEARLLLARMGLTPLS
jgi:hypothetical protein